MANDVFICYMAEVISVDDEQDGDRIKAYIASFDNKKSLSEIPYAFPLMPKMIHVKPKVGEAVFVFCSKGTPDSQRLYIGPIISQPQFMYKSRFDTNAFSLLKTNNGVADEALSNKPNAQGVLAKNEDVAIYGRKDTDIILSDNDVRIRCGVRHTNTSTNEVEFNKDAPAFIKLKHYDTPLSQSNATDEITKEIEALNNKTTESTVTIVGDKVNIISPNGDPYIKTSDTNEGISDEDMKKLLETAHKLPYGDILCDFLYKFANMFKTHTHKYHNMPPCDDTASATFDNSYGLSKENYENKILSDSIRIN